MEDEFLWYQRRAIIALCAGIFFYGLAVEPKLLLMAPILLFVALFALGGIIRDKTNPHLTRRLGNTPNPEDVDR